jgi:hypothetical protein
MDKKVKYIKIHPNGVIFFSVLLFATSFYSGISFAKTRLSDSSQSGTTTASTAKATATFAASKSENPKFQFYVMSFCPYGNQMEQILKPVVDLIGKKAEIRPQYIFDKITDLGSFCKSRSGDPAQCATYVQNKYFPDEASCKKAIAQNVAACNDEKSYLKIGNVMYASLHGRQEANQDVREICAWNQTEDKQVWWNFVDNVNASCTSQNADTCWEDQAKKAGLDTTKITDCFNKDAAGLIEKEIALTDQNRISGSPTLMINGQMFPPSDAYTQDNKGVLKIGNKTFTQDKLRSPNTIKEAICASFNNPPKECKTVLAELNNGSGAAAAGGCAQ